MSISRGKAKDVEKSAHLLDNIHISEVTAENPVYFWQKKMRLSLDN